MNDILLEVKDLRVYYDKVEALKGVSFKVERRGMITLIGANGAGKTTLLRVISGIKRATSGEIYFDGKRIDRSSPQNIVALGIAHVPEDRRIFPKMTVYENLKMGAFLRKDKEGIRRDIEKVNTYFPILKERLRQLGGSMSGGEQQMLAIGRSLMTRASLIMMDEPSHGLSPLMVQTISKVIREINHNEGASILLVEQNTRMALKITQRGYVLETGKVTLEGYCSDLINDERVKEAYLGA
jgi:branched-chain amino acid transport system ATP-binding protein